LVEHGRVGDRLPELGGGREGVLDHAGELRPGGVVAGLRLLPELDEPTEAHLGPERELLVCLARQLAVDGIVSSYLHPVPPVCPPPNRLRHMSDDARTGMNSSIRGPANGRWWLSTNQS